MVTARGAAGVQQIAPFSLLEVSFSKSTRRNVTPAATAPPDNQDMLDAILSGRLANTPSKRQTKAGAPFAAARVRVPMHDGTTAMVSVSAFDPEPMAALLVLAEGDAVSIAGPLTLTTWTGQDGQARPSAAMLAHNVLTTYSVNKKRKAQPEAMPVPSPGQVGSLF